jgi:hypothetical protein
MSGTSANRFPRLREVTIADLRSSLAGGCVMTRAASRDVLGCAAPLSGTGATSAAAFPKGNQAAYDRYRANVFQKRLADEQAFTAQVNEVNWAAWGPGWYY